MLKYVTLDKESNMSTLWNYSSESHGAHDAQSHMGHMMHKTNLNNIETVIKEWKDRLIITCVFDDKLFTL